MLLTNSLFFFSQILLLQKFLVVYLSLSYVFLEFGFYLTNIKVNKNQPLFALLSFQGNSYSSTKLTEYSVFCQIAIHCISNIYLWLLLFFFSKSVLLEKIFKIIVKSLYYQVGDRCRHKITLNILCSIYEISFILLIFEYA